MPKRWDPRTRQFIDIQSKKITNNQIMTDIPAVTPDKQKFGSDGNKLTIEKIINDEEISSKFMNNEFPKFKTTSEGIFFQPIAKLVSNMHQYVIKWFAISKDGYISHDHDYEFTKLILNGYLMRCAIPLTLDQGSHIGYATSKMNYEISYCVKVDNIEVEKIYEKRFVSNGDVIHDDSDWNMIVRYSLPSPDIEDNPELENLLRILSDDFDRKYLYDIDQFRHSNGYVIDM